MFHVLIQKRVRGFHQVSKRKKTLKWFYCFRAFGKTLENNKTTQVFSCVWKPDETLALVFELVHETWLDESFSCEEVWLPGFSLLRKDGDCHGGGLAAYIAEHLSFNESRA